MSSNLTIFAFKEQKKQFNATIEMKKFKAIPTVVLLIMMIPFMQACLDANNDLDGIPSDNMPYNTALATVIVPSEIAGEAMIENDNEGCAYVVNPAILTRKEANNQGQRIFYNYIDAESPKGKQDSKGPYIQITDLLKILTKEIDFLKEGEEDIYGNDGIYLMSYNLNKKYLTLQFQIQAYDSKIKHRISLVAKEGAVPDEKGILPLELRHNREGDRLENITMPAYVSFLLTKAPGYKEGTLKGFDIHYETIDYGETNLKLQFTDSKAANSFFPFSMENNSDNTKIK